MPSLQYGKIEFDLNFRAYLESILTANSFLRTGIQKTLEINVGSQSRVADFMGVNKQFSFIQFHYFMINQSNMKISATGIMLNWQVEALKYSFRKYKHFI